jgi:hypothetical protein
MPADLKIIAYHLPQFHPIAENSQWWGAGFTEWRNVARARPLFWGHQQPNIPGELGFYDLRLHETRVEQAELAAWAGIDAFCYYHYWFAGKLLLERPLELLLAEKQPTFPFCLCWANHDWTGHWAGTNEMLIQQTYPGVDDHRRHYEYLRRFFDDPRYLRIGGRPMLAIHKPKDIPQWQRLANLLQEWAYADRFGGIFLVGLESDRSLLSHGFSAIAPHSLNLALNSYLKGTRRWLQAARQKLLKYPRWTIPYEQFCEHFENHAYDGITILPTAIPNWDNTPRIGRRGVVISHSSPSAFQKHLSRSIRGMQLGNGANETILIIKSWNEWAEGNYLEPDLKWGRGWLEAVRNFRSDTERTPIGCPDVPQSQRLATSA